MEDTNMMRLAAEVLAADPEKLAAAIETIIKTSEQLDKLHLTQPESGGFLVTLAKRFHGMLKAANKPKRSNLQIGDMKLARFKADDRVSLVAVDPPRPEVGKKSRDLWRIDGERYAGTFRFSASKNGQTLFAVEGASFGMTEKIAIYGLHKWVEERKRRNGMRRRAKKAADTAEGSES